MSEWIVGKATGRAGPFGLINFGVAQERRATAPPPEREEGTPAPKFSGPPIRLRFLRGVASSTWAFDAGAVAEVPEELARQWVAAGTAKLSDARLTRDRDDD